MVLQPQVKKQGVKLFCLNRGGFMDVARHAKSNKIARFKNHLFKTQRWTIALSTPSTKPNVNKRNYVPKHYRKVLLDVPSDPDDPDDDDTEKIKFYYVVTALDNIIETDHSIDNRANIDELVDVDYAAIARCLKTTTNAVMKAISSNVFYKLDAESKNNKEDIDDNTGEDDIVVDEGDGTEANVEDITKEVIESENVHNLDVRFKNNAISIILNAMTEVESELSDSTAPPPTATNTEVYNTPPTPNTKENNSPPSPPTNAEEPPPPTTNAAVHNAPPPPKTNTEEHNTSPPIITKENNAPPPSPTNAEEHNAPPPTNDAEQNNARPPPSFDAEQYIVPPPANAEQHNAGATTNTEEHNTSPPIIIKENNAPPPPPTNAEELNAEATTISVEAASKSPPPATPIQLTSQKQSSTSESTITSTTTPPLTSETDSPSTPVKTSPSLASKNVSIDGKTTPVKKPGCTHMSQRIRTPTPPRYGSHIFSSILPNKLYSNKNVAPSLKRKSLSPSKKKSKVSH
jgi:hypothetical protein